MKKSIIIAIVALTLGSCKKTKSEPPCNCGTILSDNAADYSVVIRNECTNNSKTFYLAQGDWMNAHPGNRYCITNSGKW